MILLIALLVGIGGLAVLVGELLGVASDSENDTITEWGKTVNRLTRGLFLPVVLAGLGWLGYHFVTEWWI